mgnify:CR=1 FL=1
MILSQILTNIKNTNRPETRMDTEHTTLLNAEFVGTLEQLIIITAD